MSGLVVRKFQKSDLALVETSASFGGTVEAIMEYSTFVYAGGSTGLVRKLQKSNLAFLAPSHNYGGTIHALGVDIAVIPAGSIVPLAPVFL